MNNRKKLFSLVLTLIMFTGVFNMNSNVTIANASGTIQSIIDSMTTQQKVAQMIIPAFRGWDNGNGWKDATTLNSEQKAVLKKYSFGGVILFGQNTKEAGQTVDLVNSMQKANSQGASCSSLFIAIDQEGGQVTRLGTGTSMPGNMALAATGNPDYAYMAADVIGNELAVQGINVNFAPVMDVNNDPANPIIGVRSFSDDPNVVATYGTRFVDGLHNNAVMAALKHFPGHGDTDTDSHSGLPLIEKTYEQIKQTELVPFASAVKSADFIMTAHIQYPNIEKGTYTSISTGEQVYLPATLSKTILTGILRNDMGFEGIIITDAMEMDAISKHFDSMDAARLAINAGADMLLIPADMSSTADIKAMDNYINGIVAQIDSGLISIDNVNASVYRILSTKAKYGLMNDDSLNVMKKASRITPSKELAVATVGSKAHHDIEWTITLQAITSVKNDNAFPVAGDKKVVVLYPSEDQKNSIDYAVKKLNEDGIAVNAGNVTSICTKDKSIESLEASINGADVVIAITATSSATVTGADTILYMIAKTHTNGGKFILLSSQLPYDTALFTDADGIVACYNTRGMDQIPTGLPGQTKYGPGIPAAIYAIFGGSPMTGTLPVTIK